MNHRNGSNELLIETRFRLVLLIVSDFWSVTARTPPSAFLFLSI